MQALSSACTNYGGSLAVAICGTALIGASLFLAKRCQPRSTTPAIASVVTSTDDDAAPSSTVEVKSKIRTALEQRGVTLRRLPLALLLHEILGVGIMAASFAACYYLRIVKTLERFLEGSHAHRWLSLTSEVMARVETKTWVKALDRRALEAFVESVVLRVILKPILVPLKLWATFLALRYL